MLGRVPEGPARKNFENQAWVSQEVRQVPGATTLSVDRYVYKFTAKFWRPGSWDCRERMPLSGLPRPSGNQWLLFYRNFESCSGRGLENHALYVLFVVVVVVVCLGESFVLWVLRDCGACFSLVGSSFIEVVC